LNLPAKLKNARVVLTGAGTSAYAASAVASAWPRALAVPTTDLLIDSERYLLDVDAVVSLARSGDSPESAAVVERVRALKPGILQFAIVCNKDSALSRSGLDGLIPLDPRTNDKSLVMTSSFSNLVLGGLVLAQPDAVASTVDEFSKRAAALLPEIDQACKRAVTGIHDRIVVLLFLALARLEARSRTQVGGDDGRPLPPGHGNLSRPSPRPHVLRQIRHVCSLPPSPAIQRAASTRLIFSANFAQKRSDTWSASPIQPIRKVYSTK
jgi:hypothetical protein